MADHLMTIGQMTDATGNVDNEYTHSAYGVARTVNEQVSQRYRFTQREIDGAAGMYYYRNRYYGPALGRFAQVDPLGHRAGINRYVYVGANPVVSGDASGLQATECKCPVGRIECDLFLGLCMRAAGAKYASCVASCGPKECLNAIGGERPDLEGCYRKCLIDEYNDLIDCRSAWRKCCGCADPDPHKIP